MQAAGVVALARQRPRTAFAALFALFGILVGAWAAATPIGQTPDEWAHIVRASSVVHGEVVLGNGKAVDAHRGDPVRVPQLLARRSAQTACYRHHASIPVSCAAAPSGSQRLVASATTAGRYPPLYYAAVGWPLLLFGAHTYTFYVMRLVTVVLSALLLASGALAALRLRARFTMAGYAVALTPMVAYLGGMVNPNGLEITGSLALWPNLLLWLDGPTRRDRRAGLLGAVIAAAAVVLARTAAIAWVGVAVLAVLVLVRRHWFRTEVLSRRGLTLIGAVIAAVVAATAWALAVNETAIAPIHTATFTPTHYTLLHNMHRAAAMLMHWLRQAIADFGWLDTQLAQPYYDLYFAAFFVIVGLGVIGVLRGRWRPGLAAAITSVLAVLATCYFAARTANELRITFWQGRYSIATAAGVPIVIAFAAGSWRGRFRWAAAIVAAVTTAALGVLHIAGFLRFFHRNTVGLARPFTWGGTWHPPLGIVLWLVLLLLSLAALCALTVASAAGADDLEPEQDRAVPA
jgi:hypothetical protein